MGTREGRGSLRPRRGDALVIVDLQQDFSESGRLAVPGMEGMLPAINRMIQLFQAHSCPVIATRDWHPDDHCSFVGFGGRWPAHCVQGSPGAEFLPGLKLPADVLVVSKGTQSGEEAYSAFAGTGLSQSLQVLGVQRAFVCGVATEFCVLETAKDALAAGYEVVLLGDCIRPVHPYEGQRALREMLDLGVFLHEPSARDLAPPDAGVLLTDLYQLTMMQGYFDRRMEQTAVFEFFVRKLPAGRNFLLAAGLEQALDYLAGLRFTATELEWLAHCGHFRPGFVDYLAQLRFTGDVHAMPEGTVFFPQEPILRVTAPLPQAQLVESRLINLLQFQTLIASKAARSVLVAPDKLLVDFGMRRAHGAEAGLLAARAAWIAGFSGTATVEAGRRFDIPVYGTMAHSFIQAHEDEGEAFEHFALANPENVVLLLDTYDTEAAAVRSVELARSWRTRGIRVKGVRLDSGDLAEHARRVRRILDEGGLADVTIFASGNLDELRLRELVSSAAPIDGFGIGSRLDVSADAPYLDCAYKLQEYAGMARRKRSEGKATWPGRKQVYRTREGGVMLRDTVTLEQEPAAGAPLLRQVMRDGIRTESALSLDAIRQHARANLAELPPRLRELEPADAFPVDIADSVRQLARHLDQAPPGAVRRGADK